MKLATRSAISKAYIPALSTRISILALAADGTIPQLPSEQVGGLIGVIQNDLASMSQAIELAAVAEALGVPTEAAAAQLEAETKAIYVEAAAAQGIPEDMAQFFAAIGVLQIPRDGGVSPAEAEPATELTDEENALYALGEATIKAKADAAEAEEDNDFEGGPVS